MRYRSKDILTCKVRARDGTLGSVVDILFDDRDWTVRYAVVDTGGWLEGKQVLLPRETLGSPDRERRELEVSLTREEVEASPGTEHDPPLAQETRLSYFDDWSWTTYGWGGFIGGAHPIPPKEPPPEAASASEEKHLRSIREITDYRIEARDGGIGHVEEFVLRDDDWRVEYVVVDTRNWLPGKKVVVSPAALSRIDWRDRRAHVDRTQEQVKESPEIEELAAGSGTGEGLAVIRR